MSGPPHLFALHTEFIKETHKDELPDPPRYVDKPMPGAVSRDAMPNKLLAIIGAGIAGLYPGMILRYLGLMFEMFEESDRTGGRIVTHQFKKEPGPYKYFDVGAMRFPRTVSMARTFAAVDKLNKFMV